jgi:DNA-binding transcriptional ArsR family regulator
MNEADKQLLDLKAEVLQAVGHPIRLAIVELLQDGELCVCDIAEHVGAERSNVSRHLSVLLKAGVLSVRKDGLRMIYALQTPCVLTFLSCVNEVLRQRLERSSAALESL